MIRNATFALVLIAAAFAGGAAMSGPGLAWVRKTVGAGPSIIVDADPSAGPAQVQAPASARPRRFPTAKPNPIQVNLGRPAADPKKGARDLALAEPQFGPESPSTPAAALIRLPGAPAPEPPAMPAPSTQVVDRGPAPPASPLPPLELPLEPVPTKSDPVARLVSNFAGPATAPPDGIPPEVAPPVASPPAPEPTRAPPQPPSSGWTEIRRRLKDLGVTRYRIESETEGRVRFSCVIPVEGLRAVSHHFEAEGDDEPQAAEAVLRRVALWRATEGK